jgi:hypothetical protein
MANFDFMSVNATGQQVTSGGTSAVVALPVNAAGKSPKHVRLQCTGNVYVRPGGAGTTCTVNDILLSPNNDVFLDTANFTHLAYLQETAAAKINITPLET